MKTDNEIVTRMRQLEKMRPSIYGNSIMMGLLRLATLILGVFLIGMFVLKKIDNSTAPFIIEWLGGNIQNKVSELGEPCITKLHEQQTQIMANVLSNLYLATGILMLFISRLTVMVGRRNAFLMDFVEILDQKENVQ
jgi:MFS family permease